MIKEYKLTFSTVICANDDYVSTEKRKNEKPIQSRVNIILKTSNKEINCL